MGAHEIDVRGSLAWKDGFPVPDWGAILKSVESHQAEARRDALLSVARQWLAELRGALGDAYETLESRHFLCLAPRADAIGRQLLAFAARCRATLLSILGEIADFDRFGKPALVVFRNRSEYYSYISLFYEEGEYGGSMGVHIRDGYPHVAFYGTAILWLENVLAHELTHVALHHLTLPQWLEEGFAQMVEHIMLPRGDATALQVTADMPERHRRHWRQHGLDAFWHGKGFSAPGVMQRLSYELAVVLVRLLVEESRPGWFGRGRDRQRRFVAFVRAARESDCGEAAAREHLRSGLGDLAATFLGPGSWSPGPVAPEPS